MARAAEVRFFDKVDKDPGGCWLWTGSLNKDGYGSFGEGGRVYLAHRWAYARFVAAIPDGLYVLHSCDTPGCVNPSHLFLGTQADNVADCARKGRRSQSRFQKLSPELHEQIRERYATGRVAQTTLAGEFGVSQATISFVLRRGGAKPLTRSESGKLRGTYAVSR